MLEVNLSLDSEKLVADTIHQMYVDLSAIIRSTYEHNPTEFSLDLIKAMLRQREFIRNIVLNISPTWKDPAKLEFPAAIRDYHDFLLMIKHQKSDIAIQPSPIVGKLVKIQKNLTYSSRFFLLIDMIWHVHMLHPSHYYDMAKRELGRLLNHDDVIGHHRLEDHYAATDLAWNHAYYSSRITRTTAKRILRFNDIFRTKAHVYDKLQKYFISQSQRTKLQSKSASGLSKR